MTASEMISREIAGMQGFDAALRLAEMGYTGWVHESAVWLAGQGWTWRVTSTRWEGGYVVKTCTARPPYRYAAERDIAASQCAVAISAILESRGGVCCQESQEVI